MESFQISAENRMNLLCAMKLSRAEQGNHREDDDRGTKREGDAKRPVEIVNYGIQFPVRLPTQMKCFKKTKNTSMSHGSIELLRRRRSFHVYGRIESIPR